jgi:valyl-tRNA synthetase
MAHPLIPFVTEAIWEHVPGADGLLAGARAPAPAPERIDEQAEASVGRMIEAVQAVRGWRETVGAKPGAWLDARLEADGYAEVTASLARLARLRLVDNGGAPVATVPVQGGAIAILPTDELDLGEAERKKTTERERLRAEITRAEGKLANQSFVERAPDSVVQAERDKLARLQAELEAVG